MDEPDALRVRHIRVVNDGVGDEGDGRAVSGDENSPTREAWRRGIAAGGLGNLLWLAVGGLISQFVLGPVGRGEDEASEGEFVDALCCITRTWINWTPTINQFINSDLSADQHPRPVADFGAVPMAGRRRPG